MSNYTQITYEERVIIADLWRKHKSYYYIAKWLERQGELPEARDSTLR